MIKTNYGDSYLLNIVPDIMILILLQVDKLSIREKYVNGKINKWYYSSEKPADAKMDFIVVVNLWNLNFRLTMFKM